MERLLIVDDNHINRQVLREMLELQGHQVIEAGSGDEAIDLFQRHPPDLVLMDIMMPGMDGHETTRRLKRLAGARHTPVIYVTAKSATSALPTALEAGGDDFIGKPVDFNILQAKVRAHLRIRALNRKLDEQNRQLAHQQRLIEHFFDNALQQSHLEPTVIRHHLAPMSAFNGDLLLAERSPHGSLYILMGDFTGHGLSAAMGTLPAAQAFFAMARKGLSIAEMARGINRQLASLLPPGMFLAATLLELSVSGQHVTLWSGGMPKIWWLNAQGHIKTCLPSFHMPLGILEDAKFDASTRSYPVNHGDRLYLLSDGLIEASSNGQSFGEQRLQQALSRDSGDPFDNVLAELNRFLGDQEQGDDISLIEIRCRPLEQVHAGDQPSDADLLPWQLSLQLDSIQLRHFDPVTLISNMLSGNKALARHHGLIQTLLSELYAYTLEQGLLQLDGQAKADEHQLVSYYQQREQALARLENAHLDIYLSLRTDRHGGLLIMRMGHNGEPMPVTNEGIAASPGMQLITELCEDVSMLEHGRATSITFRL